VAGTVVAAMLVPQAMAYAALAGVPPVAGLYAAAASLLVYGLIGPSRSLSVGPVAIDSLLTAQAVGGLVALGGAEAQNLAALLALLAAGAYLLFWLLRLSVLAALLTAPMLAGFTHAAALVIAFSQVKHLVGVPVAEGARPIDSMLATLRALPDAHAPTAWLGLGTWALLVAWRRGAGAGLARLGVPTAWAQAVGRCAPLAATVVASVAVLAWGLAERGVATVGEVPSGLPRPAVPHAPLASWLALGPTALAIAAVGILEALSIARTLAARRHERVRPHAELLALGACNAAAGVVGGFPVTGGLSRSMVNHQAGAASGRASLVTSVLLVLALALLTGAFEPIPRAALAAVVIMAVGALFDPAAFVRAFRADPLEGFVAVATFLVVLLWSVELGMAVGALVALGVYLRRHPGGPTRALAHLLRPERPERVLVPVPGAVGRWRVAGPACLANAEALETALADAIERTPADGRLELDLGEAPWIDATAHEVLERSAARARAQGLAWHVDGRLPGR
jgi:SulP family sulfate permease